MNSVNLSAVKQQLMSVILKHAGQNEQLENDLLKVIETLDEEQRNLDKMKSFLYEIASKF
jgi:hypothetical protein